MLGIGGPGEVSMPYPAVGCRAHAPPHRRHRAHRLGRCCAGSRAAGAPGPLPRARSAAPRVPSACGCRSSLGDLADPPSFRNALRGVRTVVHLAGSTRDQPGGSIEELNGIATWRMVEAARRAGVEHFVFCSAGGAPRRTAARASCAPRRSPSGRIAEAGVPHTIVGLSLAYAPGDSFLAMLDRLALLPGRAGQRPRPRRVRADLGRGRGRGDHGGPRASRPARAGAASSSRGPQTLTHDGDRRHRAAGRATRGGSCTCRRRSSAASLRPAETLMKSKAPVTWDEAELLEVSMTSRAAPPTPRRWACRRGRWPTSSAPRSRGPPRAERGPAESGGGGRPRGRRPRAARRAPAAGPRPRAGR